MTKIRTLIASFLLAAILSQTASGIVFVQRAPAGGITDFDDLSAAIGLWLDADDISTLWQTSDCSTTAVVASGNTVRCWEDKSPNAFQFVNSSAVVTYTTSVIGSEGAVDFPNNTQGWLGHLNNTVQDVVGDATNAAYTMFIVIEQSTTTSNDTLIGFGNTYTNMVQFNFAAADFRWISGTYPAGYLLQAHPTGWDGATHIVMARRNGTTNQIIRVDGTDIATDTSVSGWVRDTSTDDLYIGKRYDGKQLDGTVAFIIIYKEALSDSDRDDVEQLLNDRYSVF